MNFGEKKSTIKDVDKVIDEFKNVKRPDMDNEGDSANDPDFYNYLSESDKKIVDDTTETIKNYIKNDDGSPNKRAITLMNKRGYKTTLHIGQYSENEELVGSVEIKTDNKDDEDDDLISINLDKF